MEQSPLTVSNPTPHEARKTADSTIDRIYKYYHPGKSTAPPSLTEKEDEIRIRIEKAWMLMTEHKTRKHTAEELEKFFSIHKWQAYDDIKNAMLLFSDPGPQFKEAKRAMAETFILKAMEMAYNEKNVETYEKLIGRYMKNAGLEVDDDSEMANKLKAMRTSTFIFTSDPDLLKQQAKNLVSNLPAEDVEFQPEQ